MTPLTKYSTQHFDKRNIILCLFFYMHIARALTISRSLSSFIIRHSFIINPPHKRTSCYSVSPKSLLFSIARRNHDENNSYNENSNNDDEEEEEAEEESDNDVGRTKIRYRGRVAYDGTGYNGWQTQTKGRTVQAELELILSKRFNRPIKIVGAGRTDAGVHARGQAFHFDLLPTDIILPKNNNNNNKENDNKNEKEKNEKEFTTKLQKSINSMLRYDARVWNISRAPILPPPPYLNNPTWAQCQWHAIITSTSKLYSYRICIADYLNPIQRHTRVHIYEPISIPKLNKTLQHYVGTHDFRAFAGAIEANMRKSGVEDKNTVRTVYKIDLVEEEEEGEGNYRIDVYLKGALYKMIRNMIGTALEVARGRVEEDVLIRLLHHEEEGDGDDDDNEEENEKQRQFVRDDNPCKPAPPEGLTLERVYYDDDDDF